MPKVTIKELLEVGAHFGHLVKRWNPKMKPFIFAQRRGVHVIDLSQTVKRIDEAYEFLRQVASEGKKIVFVGTKRQAREIIKKEALRAGVMYIAERWPGGFITNFDSVKKSLDKLREMEKMKASGEIEKLTKKELSLFNKRFERLEKLIGGVRDLESLPDVLFILDVRREKTAVLEANKLKIPIVAVTDSNANPELVTYPIPANDDAIKSIKILVSLMTEAVIEGKEGENLVKVKEKEKEKETLRKTEEDTETTEKKETRRKTKVVEISDLGLPARVEGALVQAKIKTVDRLKKLSNEEILAIKGIGESALKEIRKSISKSEIRSSK